VAQEPEVIRRQIEETRERVGEDVDALGHKLSPKEQVKDKAAAVKEKAGNVVSSITGGAGSAAEGIGSAASSVKDGVGSAASTVAGGVGTAASSVKEGAVKTASVAKDNPLGLAIGAAAAGFLVGLVIPITRKENEKLGPMADSVKEKAAETGREALDRGKQVVQQVAEQAKETAKEAGQEQAEELRSSTAERIQEVPQGS
jgi:phage-related protein